jgi:hypothetical protein
MDQELRFQSYQVYRPRVSQFAVQVPVAFTTALTATQAKPTFWPSHISAPAIRSVPKHYAKRYPVKHYSEIHSSFLFAQLMLQETGLPTSHDSQFKQESIRVASPLSLHLISNSLAIYCLMSTISPRTVQLSPIVESDPFPLSSQLPPQRISGANSNPISAAHASLVNHCFL